MSRIPGARTPLPNPQDDGSGVTVNMRAFQEVVANVMMSRAEMWKNLLDPRRNVFDECGFPRDPVTSEFYYQLYTRDAISSRVVEVLPKESWQTQPSIYEDEDANNVTEFEEVWDGLAGQLRGDYSWYQDEEGSPVLEYLKRLDEQAGVGQFGLLFIGIDDNLPWSSPANGIDVADSVGIFSGGTDQEYYRQYFQQQKADAKSPTGKQYPALRAGGGYFGGTSWEEPKTGQNATAQKKTRTKTGPDVTGAYPGAGGGKGTNGTAKQGAAAITPGPTKGSPGASRPQPKTGRKGERSLIFLRVFPEYLCQVTQYESNPSNPRYGQPVMYLLTFNDPREAHGGVGLPVVSFNVHWTRIVHVADNLVSSEVYGTPRMKTVLNNLLSLQKLYGGSAEMYWRGAFPGWTLSTHPQLGGDVELDKAGLRDMMENYMNGLQRYLLLMGMSAQSMAPQVVSPTEQINAQLEAICIKLGCPIRVFKGSERGELASSQDDAAWNDRLRERQRDFITPRIIVPFVDRLIMLKVLPPPEGYSVFWPDLTSQTQTEKAQIAMSKTQAIAAFAQIPPGTISPEDFWTRIIGLDEEEAETIIENAKKHQEEAQQQAEETQLRQQQMGLAPAPGAPGGAGPPGAGGPPRPGGEPPGAGKPGVPAGPRPGLPNLKPPGDHEHINRLLGG